MIRIQNDENNENFEIFYFSQEEMIVLQSKHETNNIQGIFRT